MARLVSFSLRRELEFSYIDFGFYAVKRSVGKNPFSLAFLRLL